MIYIKNTKEIELITRAGEIVETVLTKLGQMVAPGVTTIQLDQEAERIITKMGATPSFKGYGGFPSSICASVNQVLIHGIPNKTPLKNGDIISIDVGACFSGYHADAARTFPVGKISKEAADLIEHTQEALNLAIAEVKPNARIGDISNAIEMYIQKQGYSIPIEYTGHGVGRNLHEDPVIPNWGQKGQGARIKEGMVLAIEPMVNSGTRQTTVLADQWTVVTKDGKLAAHFENTVVVTKDGCQVLTQKEGGSHGKTRCN